ncbi:MAG: hypothetical protein ACREO5_04980, partial [Candidatus Binatia bacterium]
MLSGLSQPNYPKAAVGIERDKLTMLAIQKEGRGQFSLKQAASVDVPVGLIEPSFLEKNIRNQAEFLYLLEEAASVSGLLNQKRWSVALPSNTGRSALLTLDAVPSSRQELDEVLDWKAEHSFGVPASELRMSMQKISPDREGKLRYFATAVKLIVIDEFEAAFEAFGWNAGLILPRAVSESNWLFNRRGYGDSLLLSAQNDGFTALLLRGGEPRVVRSVTCTVSEIDDEIYRLLMFYNDRFVSSEAGGVLDGLLVIGKTFVPDRIREISREALGKAVEVYRPLDVGMEMPVGSLDFDDVAAPAGLAALGA